MASESLEVGDYVRWDKTNYRANEWSLQYGDGMMVVERISEDMASLRFVDSGELVGVSVDPDPWFYHHRFVKQVFLSAASQANRKKEPDGNTQTTEVQ